MLSRTMFILASWQQKLYEHVETLGGHTYVVGVALYNSAQYLSAFFATTYRKIAPWMQANGFCTCVSANTCIALHLHVDDMYSKYVRTPQSFKSFAWCYMQRCTYIKLGLWRCKVKRTHRRDLRIYTHTLRTRRPLHALFQ